MTIPLTNMCSVCLEPLGETFKSRDHELTTYVTSILHKPTIGPEHRIHRICAFEWFQEQIDNEPAGIDLNDLTNLPFSCPLCKEKLSLKEAELAAGVPLDAVIRISRMSKGWF